MTTKYSKYSLSAILALAFVGCGGGGGGSSDTSVTPTTYTVSGTVPGTIIEAYCSNGSTYSTTSTNNGTSKHPFSLTLPVNAECKIVMITNETASNPADYIITPLEFESKGSTGTYFKIDKNIDLGNVAVDTPSVNSAWSPGVRSAFRVTMDTQTVTVKSLANDPMDSNNDGIPNVYENDDGDALPNKYDDDSDNNGIKDVNENIADHDHDGIADIYDKDDDNDGVADTNDSSSNGETDDDSDDNNSPSNTTPTTPTTLPTTFVANDGRLLGSQCAQCHGTNGVSSSSIDSIKGENNLTHEIYDDDPIMNAQAKGYTATEIVAIENWLNSL